MKKLKIIVQSFINSFIITQALNLPLLAKAQSFTPNTKNPLIHLKKANSNIYNFSSPYTLQIKIAIILLIKGIIHK